MKSVFNSLFNTALYHFAKAIKNQPLYFRRIGLKVGSNCRILTNKFGSEPYLITIGNNVTVTSGVRFVTHDGSGALMRDSKGRRYSYQPIKIGNNVFVGVNSILMPGIQIEDNVIIAAGSVVTKSIPQGVIVAGVPAKIIGKFEDLESRMLASYISDEDFKNQKGAQKEKILKLTDYSFKPFLAI